MRDGEVLYESLRGLSAEGKPEHAAVLLGEIERAAAAAGGWGAVDLIAVGVGPGSFTGVRIGIATARGVGASAALPVAGVCTLDAIGSALRERSDETELPSLLAVLDARRDEVFAALYSEGERVWEPLVSAPNDLAKRVAALPQPPLAAGSGRYDFARSWLGKASRSPMTPIPCTGSRHGTSVLLRRQGARARSPRSI